MRTKKLDLIGIMAFVAINIACVLLPYHVSGVGIVLTLPLVFLLPGYVLTEVLSQNRFLEASHRLTLSIGLSLAIDILSGFILNMFPLGLQALSWVAFLGLFTMVFALIAVYLRRGGPVNRVRIQRFRLPVSGYILFGLAIPVVFFSVLYSIEGVVQQPHPGFTQLWMLPPVQGTKGCAVRLGIRNFESATTTYRVTMTTNGAQATTWQSVVLDPQEEWRQLVPITLGAADDAYVEVRLYQSGKPATVYQKVNLMLHRNGQVQQCNTG